MALKAHANPVCVSKGGFSHAGSIFWGESVKGGVKSGDLGTQLRKNLRIEKGTKRAYRGVVYSVLTPDIEKEALVSTHHITFFLFGLGISLLSYIINV